jgi:membrane protein
MAQPPGTLPRLRALTGHADGAFPVRVVRKFIADDGANQATLIAWNALVAVFPIALALAAVGGALLSGTGVGPSKIYRAVLAVLPQDASTQADVRRAIAGLRHVTGLFAIIAVVGFYWTASGLFGAMEHAFCVVFRTRGRHFLHQKLLALGMMGLFSVMVLIGVGTSSLRPAINQLADGTIPLAAGEVGYVVQAVIGIAAGFVLFFTIYYVVPNCRRTAGQVWVGALFAGTAFEALTLLFPVYIHLNRGINQYGRTLALLFILLAFFYILGLITVLGAEINAVLHSEEGGTDRRPS